MNGPARRVIALVRHGEPALSRKVSLTSSGYRDWWATYEEGGILTDQSPPDSLKAYGAKAGSLFVSTRRRAIETARAIVGERPFTPDPLFIEAPLPPPPLPDFMTVTPPYWGVIARTAWWSAPATPPRRSTPPLRRADRSCWWPTATSTT